LQLKDAIESAKKRHRQTVLKKNNAQHTKVATPTGLCRFFNFKFESYGYGAPPLITKKESNMVSGFIRLLKNNHYSDKRVYKFVGDYLEHFPKIKLKDVYTDKGKKYTMGARPNIKDLLYCKSDLLNKISVHSSSQVKSKETTDWSKETLQDTETW